MVLSRCETTGPAKQPLPTSSTPAIKKLLFRVTKHALSGNSLGAEFNFAFMAFILKEKQEGGIIQVCRAPNELRTLSLSNTDSKIVSSAVCFLMTRSLSKHILPSQFGLKGTQITDVVLQVESAMLHAGLTIRTGAAALLRCFSS